MRANQRARAVALACAALWSVAPSPAFAQTQPSTSERETARNLMDEGDRRRDAGDLKAALKAYSDADGIMNVPTTAIEVARTQAALAQLVEAKETLARLLRMPTKPSDPAPFGAARRAAEALAADVGARLPSIQVTTNADPAQPATVTIDGASVVPGTPRKMNPGNHAIVVRVAKSEHKQDTTLAEREVKVVVVDVKEAYVASAAPAPAPLQQNRSLLPKVLLYGGFGVAAVGLGVGTITGLMSIHKTNTLKPTCPNDACPVGSQPAIDSANTLGDVSTVGFVFGAAGAAAGVVGVFLTLGSDKASSGARATAAVTPVVGPGYAGFRGAF